MITCHCERSEAISISIKQEVVSDVPPPLSRPPQPAPRRPALLAGPGAGAVRPPPRAGLRHRARAPAAARSRLPGLRPGQRPGDAALLTPQPASGSAERPAALPGRHGAFSPGPPVPPHPPALQHPQHPGPRSSAFLPSPASAPTSLRAACSLPACPTRLSWQRCPAAAPRRSKRPSHIP